MSIATGIYRDLTLLATRVAVGGYLGLAGVSKAAMEIREGPGAFLRGPFAELQPSWLPDVMAAPYGLALPWLEIVVGAALAAGFLARFSAALTGAMIASFTVALAMRLGIAAQPATSGGPFSANYIQVAVCALLVSTGPGRLSVDAWLRGPRGRRASADG